jgi:hypothetical protein
MQPNMSEQSTRTDRDKQEPPPTRAQRLAAFGFLGAFALTILTVLLTGLKVGAPSARHVLHPGPPAAETGAPSVHGEAPAESSGPVSAAPAAAPADVDEPPANENTASREDAARDPDDGTRKDSRRDAGEARGSRANDSR